CCSTRRRSTRAAGLTVRGRGGHPPRPRTSQAAGTRAPILPAFEHCSDHLAPSSWGRDGVTLPVSAADTYPLAPNAAPPDLSVPATGGGPTVPGRATDW